MNKQKPSVNSSAGHRTRGQGLMTGSSEGSGGQQFKENLKPSHGVVDYGREGFDLIRHRAVESAKYFQITLQANSHEALAVGVGIGSLLGYLAVLRWVCDRF